MKRKSKFWFMVFACLGIAGFCLAVSGGPDAKAEEKPPLRIGFIDSFTSTPAPYGLETRAGVETAVDEINQKGGVLGRRIELLVMDDKASPDTGLSNAKDLVLGKKAEWLVGVTTSNVGLAVSGFAKEAKVPYIATIAVSERLTGELGHRYLFRMNTNTRVYGYTSGLAAAKLNIKKWWIISFDYEFGHACTEVFKRVLKAQRPDVEFVGEGWIKPGNPDYTPYLAPAVASDAQGVYNNIGGADFIRIFKDGGRLGLFTKKVLLGPDMGMINTYYAIGKEMPEGIWGATSYQFWEHAANPRSEHLYQSIMKKIGRPPGNGSPSGYEAIWAIARAAEKAGTTDREKLIDTLEGMTLDTVVGPVTIRDFDHQAIWPFWFGQTKFVPEFPKFPILANTFKTSGDAYPTKEEILKLRSQK